MADFGDFIAQGVITQALVCKGDSTLEDLGIMSLEPGQVILKCKGAHRIDPDELFSVPGFTPDWVYQDTMREYIEWMEKGTALMRDLWALTDEMFRFKRSPSINTMAEFEERLEEFGIGADDDCD